MEPVELPGLVSASHGGFESADHSGAKQDESFTSNAGVASEPADGESAYSQIFIAPAGDWTQSLSRCVDQWSQNGAWVAPCWIQGPYISPFSVASNYGKLILCASGIGITAALPIVQQLLTCDRAVHLIWMSRSAEQIAFFLPLLKKCRPTFVFYTGKTPMPQAVISMYDTVAGVKLSFNRLPIERMVDMIFTASYAKRPSFKSRRVRRPSFIDALAPTSDAFRRGANKISPTVGGGIGGGGRSEPASGMDSFCMKRAAAIGSSVSNETDLAVDVRHVLERLTPADRAEWAILYCGGAQGIRHSLQVTAKKWGVQFSEESFSW